MNSVWEEYLNGLPEDDRLVKEFITGLAAEIASYRNQLGLTQKELAIRANIPQSAIARLENEGNIPRVDTVIKILKARRWAYFSY